MVPAFGSQRTAVVSAGVGRRTTGMTVWPAERSLALSADPMSPEAPVMAIFLGVDTGESPRRGGGSTGENTAEVLTMPDSRPQSRDRYHPVPMSTRKLILLALACGFAILVAGSAQLFMATR